MARRNVFSTPGAGVHSTYGGAYDYLEQNLPLSRQAQAQGGIPPATRTPPVLARSTFSTSPAGWFAQRGRWAATPVRMKSTPDTVALAASTLPADGDYVMEVTTAQGPLALSAAGAGGG